MNRLSTNQKKILVNFLLIVAIFICYSKVNNFDFVGYDDELYVTGNDHVRHGISYESIAWAFSFSKSSYWHPLTWLSHMLDCQLFGLNPGFHHLTSLLLHTANSLLLFNILWMMSGTLWRSAFVAALFALHPLNVESVAWVAARKNVLSTLFWMLTMLAYAGYVKKPGLKRYLCVVLAFTAGLMAKPMLVTLPFVLLLMDYWPLGRCCNVQAIESDHTEKQFVPIFYFKWSIIWRLVLEKIPLFALMGISISLSFLSVNKIVSSEMTPVTLRMANAIVSYAGYIEKMVWPHNLAIFYPYPKCLPLWQIIISILLLAGIFLAAFYQVRKKPYFIVGWLWFIGTFVPVIGLVQWDMWPAMADRFSYIPLIGLFIILSWGVYDVLAGCTYRKIILAIGGTVIIVLFMADTRVQTGHWKNGMALFEHAVSVTDNNWVAHNNLGMVLLKNGNYNDAVYHFKEVARIKPNNAGSFYNLANAYNGAGFLDKAYLCYQKTLEIDQKHTGALNNMGNLMFRQKKLDDAVIYYDKALRIKPDDSSLHNNLANILYYKGKYDQAIVQYNLALETDPDNADAHYNFGILLLKLHETKKAMLHFTETIKIKPEYTKAYNQIGEILVEQGKYNTAGSFFSKALQIQPGYQKARENLKLLNRRTHK